MFFSVYSPNGFDSLVVFVSFSTKSKVVLPKRSRKTIFSDQKQSFLAKNQSKKKSLDQTVKYYFPLKIMKKCQTWVLQEKQEAFGFLKDEKEDIYSFNDLK